MLQETGRNQEEGVRTESEGGGAFYIHPLVLSATGGMAPQATTFYKELAACLADKWDQPYSSTMAWLRCRLLYLLLPSAIQSIRGARSRSGQAVRAPQSIKLVTSESLIR